MKIKLLSESPAPWKMSNKKIYMYKFSADMNIKNKQNSTVQQSLKKVLGNNTNKFQYSVCAVLDKNNRQYTNTQFQTYDNINIEDAIENHFNEYSVGNYQPHFKEFYVYVIQNFNPNKGGNDELNNDCLFRAIQRAYNFSKEIMPDKLKQPHKLKKVLGLERTEPIDVSKLRELEPLLNCSFEVSGDVLYTSENIKPKNINLLLKNGHYTFLSNGKSLVVNGVKVYNIKPENIYTCRKYDGITTIYDGITEREVSDEEYRTIEAGRNLIVNCKTDNLKECREKYLNKAKYFYEKYGEVINFYKSSYISKLNFKNILVKLQGTQQPDEISNHEAQIIDKCFRGGLRYYEKGTFENVYDYDINTMYAYYLTNGLFKFPIFKPEYQTITNEQFKQWDCFQYGFYYCKAKGQHKFMTPKDDFEWWTHFDLQIFKMLGFEIELSETSNNHLYYSANTRINGMIFRPYVEELYKYKNEVDEEYKPEVKVFLSTIYGSMCEKNRKKYFASEKQQIDIGDDYLHKIEPTENGVLLETTNSHKIFKNDYARVSFITAYCRLKMYQNIFKYVENLDDIIMINTDGFATKREIKDIPISSEIGKFKVKQYKSFIINHLSDIKKKV